MFFVSRLDIILLLFMYVPGTSWYQFYLHVDQTRTAKSRSYLVCLFRFLLEGFAWHMYTR